VRADGPRDQLEEARGAGVVPECACQGEEESSVEYKVNTLLQHGQQRPVALRVRARRVPAVRC